jgi:D-alanyl-D-alanine carboxypeptidase
MANSRCPGPLNFARFSLVDAPKTPGSWGVNDFGDPEALASIGDNAGPLGLNDCGDLNLSLAGINSEKLRLMFQYFSSWDFDPAGLLEHPSLNPEFVQAARDALWHALKAGLQPRVHEAYRSPDESARRHKLYTQHKGHKAAEAWHSLHNYGLAMDVWIFENGEYVDDKYAGKGKALLRKRIGFYKEFADIAKSHQLVWGHSFNDDDHFQFHPNWNNVNGPKLVTARNWALKVAAGTKDHAEDKWMEYFWWAAGAGGEEPPKEVLAKHKPPLF